MEDNILELIKEGYNYKQIALLMNINRRKIAKIAGEHNTLSSKSKSRNIGKTNANNDIWICESCGKSKDKSKFDKSSRSTCRQCKRNKYKFSSLYKSMKSRGKYAVDISTQDLKDLWEKQNGKCFYSKREMTGDSGHLNTVSVDRVDSSLGYTLDNIVLCCAAVNYMKSNLSVEDFVSFCKDIAENN